MPQSHPRRSPTRVKPHMKRHTKSPRTKSPRPMLRLHVRPHGIDVSIVQTIPRRPGEPYRERTLLWIGRNPALDEIRTACRRTGARLPNEFKETI